MRALAVLVLAACAHPAGPAIAPEPALNLGFEEGTPPTGWEIGPSEHGYRVTVDPTTAHTGARSVRMTSTPDGRYGSVSRRIDAAPLVGKRVRVHAWVKTEGVTGWAAAWLRVDGGEATYVFGDGPTGTSSGWSEAVADAFIAPGQELTFGVALAGDGTAWFDDLSLEVMEPPAGPVELAGTVTDSAGAPVVAAEVALVAPEGAIAEHTRTDAAGRFRFDAAPGTWGLSASAPGRPELVGAFLPQAPLSTARGDLRLVLGSEGGVAVAGRVDAGMRPDSYLQVATYSTFDADIFALPIAADGTFGATLPRGDRFAVTVLSGGVGKGTSVREGDRVPVELTVVSERPAPPAVAEWVARSALPLSTTDPAADPADLAPLVRLIGDARVVALGEATHGTREITQLKHRVFAELVRAQGFTVFALEMGQVEAREIDAWVLGGPGTARSALGAGRQWIWETEEMLALLEWMRAWNAAHATKVRFVGYDLQDPSTSARELRRYLERVAPDEVEALLGPVAVLAHESGRGEVAKLPAEAQAALVSAAAAVGERFDAARARWEAVSGSAAFTQARQDARLLLQGAEQYTARSRALDGSVLRDRAMAENLRWLLATLPAGARVVVSAHNMHVGDVTLPEPRMGHHLRGALGDDLVTIGTLLGDGELQALQMRRDGAHENLEAIPFGPPADGWVNAALLRAGLPMFALDLRTPPPAGPVADWLRSPQLVWEAGYAVGATPGWVEPHVLAERYDALVFLAHTTRARPLPVDRGRTP